MALFSKYLICLAVLIVWIISVAVCYSYYINIRHDQLNINTMQIDDDNHNEYNNFNFRIIHQIWIGSKLLPLLWMESWSIEYISMYPNYQYILWNNSNIKNLIAKSELNHLDGYKDGRLEELYDNDVSHIPGKADIARLVILYEFAGIYIDADSVWLSHNKINLDILFLNLTQNTNGFAALMPGNEPITKKPKQYLANGVIGFIKPKSKELKYLIQHLLDLDLQFGIKKLNEQFAIWQLTGPKMFNLIQSKLTIYETRLFYPKDWHNLRDPQLHKKLNLSNDTIMFQYGYSTNHRHMNMTLVF